VCLGIGEIGGAVPGGRIDSLKEKIFYELDNI
jgi:hypothetical protein